MLTTQEELLLSTLEGRFHETIKERMSFIGTGAKFGVKLGSNKERMFW
jgi:hypothetical protein